MHFLRIRPEQMQAFEADVRRRFAATSIERLCAAHGLDASQAGIVVEKTMARALELGLDDESDVITLMDWYATRGVGFESRPGLEGVRTTLEDDTLPGWARLKLAARLLERG